jgi:phosphatidylinositol-3-phosphatase
VGPLITSAPAYQRDGLLIINFDEGEAAIAAGSGGTLSVTFTGLFCCNEQPGPNVGPFPQTSHITPTVTLTSQSYGGDRTGAVLLSRFLEPGTVSNTPFNHFSLLKTLEDIFNIDTHLGYAGAPGLIGFFGCVSPDVPVKDPDQFAHCENR